MQPQSIRRFCIEEDAATTVEYAVMLMLILLVIISAVQFFGESVDDSFGDSSKHLDDALSN